MEYLFLALCFIIFAALMVMLGLGLRGLTDERPTEIKQEHKSTRYTQGGWQK